MLEEQPHTVAILGFNADLFATSKSIKKGSEGDKMNIYERFLLSLVSSKNSEISPYLDTTYLQCKLSGRLLGSFTAKCNGFMVMQGLLLHKAPSREVIISLFTCVPNSIARGMYLEIKRHVLSFAGAGNLVAKVNYPYTCLIAML